nr:hypothetical protein BaRGS_012815 [Batillaria attramentaria]
MGIHGLLPPVVRSLDEQMVRVMSNFTKRATDLDRYIYLMSLQERNERLFYRVLTQNVEQMMPIVYTPTVGQACQQYGVAFRRPRGLFISIKDAGHVYEMICNWPERNVKAIVVTDGERILGLGDLGVYGMGIPVGKLSLYTALGGIAPSKCLPVILDVGTNNKKLHEDPLYIGMAKERVTGERYDAFIDEFMKAVVKRYGQGCLVQFEDFGNHNAFRTAAVAAAGVFASLRITGKKLVDNTFVFQGAGEANIGIAELLALAMQEEGLPKEEAYKRIWMVDSRGLIVKDRPSGGINQHKAPFAKEFKPLTSLEEIVNELKPTALIGAAAIPGAFTENVLRSMGKFNERPIIFALSNPTSMSECTAEQAYKLTEPPDVRHIVNGCDGLPTSLQPVWDLRDRYSLKTSLANLVTDADLAEGRVYPPLSMIREVSARIATDLANYVYSKGMASFYPEPEDKEEFIRSFVYDTSYESFEPETWEWEE